MKKSKILALNIQNCPVSLDDAKAYIASSRLEQISCFRPDDQRRSLLGDLLVLRCLKEQINSVRFPLEFSVAEFGKPYLSQFPGFHFNVSHSGDWVLCATGQTPLGVDIQQERIFRPAVLRALSPEERNYLNTVPADAVEKATAFFQLWCLKEAYCKAIGLGLRKQFSSFTISLDSFLLSDPAYRVTIVPFPAEGYHVAFSSKGHNLPQPSLQIVKFK